MTAIDLNSMRHGANHRTIIRCGVGQNLNCSAEWNATAGALVANVAAIVIAADLEVTSIAIEGRLDLVVSARRSTPDETIAALEEAAAEYMRQVPGVDPGEVEVGGRVTVQSIPREPPNPAELAEMEDELLKTQARAVAAAEFAAMTPEQRARVQLVKFTRGVITIDMLKDKSEAEVALMRAQWISDREAERKTA